MSIGTSSWFVIIWNGIKALCKSVANYWRREQKRQKKAEKAKKDYDKASKSGDAGGVCNSFDSAHRMRGRQ